MNEIIFRIDSLVPSYAFTLQNVLTFIYSIKFDFLYHFSFMLLYVSKPIKLFSPILRYNLNIYSESNLSNRFLPKINTINKNILRCFDDPIYIRLRSG